MENEDLINESFPLEMKDENDFWLLALLLILITGYSPEFKGDTTE